MMGPASAEWMISRVVELAGLRLPAEGRRTLLATLRSLGVALFSDEALLLARDLPAALREALRSGPHAGRLEPAELYQRVAELEHVDAGFAREHVQVVCQVLGETLSDEAHLRWKHVLSPAVYELFALADRKGDLSSASGLTQERHRESLATARRDTSRTLSEVAK